MSNEDAEWYAVQACRQCGGRLGAADEPCWWCAGDGLEIVRESARAAQAQVQARVLRALQASASSPRSLITRGASSRQRPEAEELVLTPGRRRR